MGDRHKLKLVKQMLEVRHASRLAADAVLAAAASAERHAREAADAARVQSVQAYGEWSEHVTQSALSPEFGQALGAWLLGRDATVQQAVVATMQKSDVHSESREMWELAEATLRQSREKVRQLDRKVGRRAEEARLAELGDRVTWKWSSK